VAEAVMVGGLELVGTTVTVPVIVTVIAVWEKRLMRNG
jgi:hypothetical protein